MRGGVLIVILFVSLTWGLIPHIHRSALETQDVLTYSTIRFGLCFVLALSLMCLPQRKRSTLRMALSAREGVVNLFSALTTCFSILAFVWCTTKTSPWLVSAIAYVLGLAATVLLGACVFGDVIRPTQAMGLVLSGVAVVLLLCPHSAS